MIDSSKVNEKYRESFTCNQRPVSQTWNEMMVTRSYDSSDSNVMGFKTGQGFPCSSVGKESVCNAGDPGSIPGLERSSGEGNGKSLQYPLLENLMDRGA